MNRWIGILCLIAACGRIPAGAAEPLTFFGMCDASAAVVLRDDLFVVANDEDNVLRLYRLNHPGRAVQTFNLNLVIAGREKSPEMDLEGAAQLGEDLFLITSHGRKADGDPAPHRRQLFALQVSENQGRFDFRLKGRVYHDLVADLAADSRFARFDLANAAQRAPESPGGLNIEALTETPDGALLIGFRSPVPAGRALIIPLLNPHELVAGQPPRFGDPLTLDLGGLGLRGMGLKAGSYYLLAGPAHGAGPRRLYSWVGGGAQPQLLPHADLAGINPEAICFYDTTNRTEFVVVSDDGGRQINGMACKDLPEAQRQFRVVRLPR